MGLKKLRAKNAPTQTALAKALGISSNAISAIEGDLLKFSTKLPQKVKDVYGEVIQLEDPAEKVAEKVAAVAKER